MRASAVGICVATLTAVGGGCGSTSGDVLTSTPDSGGDDGSAGNTETSTARDGSAGTGDASPGNAGGGSSDVATEDGPVPAACGNAGLTCAAPLACAGVACTCIVACDMRTVQRSDGSLWLYSSGTVPAAPIQMQDGSLFLAASFSTALDDVSCGVRKSDATVWCWDPPGATGCDSGSQCAVTAQGDLGNGSTTQSAWPVQVVTSDGKPLANLASVAVSLFGGTACAVDGAGSAWCWGRGYFEALGTGSSNDSLVATPVLTAAGGPQLTGVAEIATNYWGSCARKTDGSVWCWGNGSSEYGDDPFPVPMSLPAQATAIGIDESKACARLSDGSLWCWGTPSDFGIAASGAPTQLLVAQGTAFAGAMTVTADNTAVHTVKADGSIWEWPTLGAAYAEPQSTGVGAIDDAFVLCRSGTNFPTYVDTSGVFHDPDNIDGLASVPCP
jgi:hypothetical protein